MERVPVVSSNIAEVGFELSSNTLEIMFKDGRVYHYFDVPPRVFEDLQGVSSVGQYFHTEIRGVYRFARV